MKHDKLAEIVDEFGRTYDAEFEFDLLADFVGERLDTYDEDELYDLAASSSYLFEVLEDDAHPRFLPRRTFFQAAEFLVTPSRWEVEGGFLFPGHRFGPFISREVFPSDAWLVLPDGSAPRVRKMTVPSHLAMENLRYFGEMQAMEYLVADVPENESRRNMAVEVEATVFDLKAFFAACGFRPGDSLAVRVLDWLQGVYAVSHVPAGSSADFAKVRGWIGSMRNAYDAMQQELGTEGDCCEQLAVMMLLGAEDPDAFPLMKAPPLPFTAFFDTQKDIVARDFGDRTAFCDADSGEEGADEAYEDAQSEMDWHLRKLGLPLSESDAEAYMREAIFRGAAGPDAVLAHIAAGRSLFFRSAEDQEEFHQLWCQLWDDVCETYSPARDPYAEIRAQVLALNDRCLAALRKTEAKPGGGAAPPHAALEDLGKLVASISGMLALFNSVEGMPRVEPENIRVMMEGLVPAVEACLARLEEG